MPNTWPAAWLVGAAGHSARRKPGQQSQESAKVCKVNRLSDPIESTEQRHRGTVDGGDSV